jgi:heptosyltransferase-2
VRTRYRKREVADALRVRVLRKPFRASRLLVRRYLDALAPLGIDAPYAPPRLHVSAQDREAARRLLERSGLSGRPLTVIVPGSVWATKRWPAEGFAGVAARLVSDHGLGVLLLGTQAEEELCRAVAERAGAGAAVVAGDTTLGTAAGLIAAARVFVGNDSGPTHMSMALGVPTVAIFGPTDPGQFDFTDHALVYADPECGACSFFGGRACRLGHWDCMRSVTVDDVLSAASGLLREGESGE